MKYADCDASLLSEVVLLLTKLEKYFEKLKDQDEEIEEALLFDYYDLSHFNKIADFFNEDFIIWVEKTKDDIHYQISCLNPKELIKMRSKLVRSSIFFSATLHPMDYFIYLLGGDESSSRLTIDSPFKREHLELFVNTKLSTKYTDREQTKEQIANSIFEVVQNNGKYLIFFPSYQYLEMVYDLFHDLVNENIILIRQERQMSEFKKRAFMAHFDTSKQHVVGFAVLGGSFSEGIDLQGERLNGVVVVGVGLPTFDDYRKELRHYFDKQGLNGYRYAFTYPGFNKILQAVGRVIRGETDQGIALLIDSRYKTSEYLSLFPRHWSHYKRI
jgi:DNA excision repair protein ERCC-2